MHKNYKKQAHVLVLAERGWRQVRPCDWQQLKNPVIPVHATPDFHDPWIWIK
jgi:hypothetical protein